MSEKYAFVMMIQDKWWREFLRLHSEGKEIQSYVLEGFAPPKTASLIVFYVTKPVGQIEGYAEFVDRKVGTAEELWNQHGQESVLNSKEQFDKFVKDKQRVTFVRFKNLQQTAKPVALNNMLMLLGMKRLARKGFYVNKETADKLIGLT